MQALFRHTDVQRPNGLSASIVHRQPARQGTGALWRKTGAAAGFGFGFGEQFREQFRG